MRWPGCHPVPRYGVEAEVMAGEANRSPYVAMGLCRPWWINNPHAGRIWLDVVRKGRLSRPMIARAALNTAVAVAGVRLQPSHLYRP